jgi:hypothetical protein
MNRNLIHLAIELGVAEHLRKWIRFEFLLPMTRQKRRPFFLGVDARDRVW